MLLICLQTIYQTGQQASLAKSIDSYITNVHFVSETHVQANHLVTFHISAEVTATYRGLISIHIALSLKLEQLLINWISGQHLLIYCLF